MQTKTSKPCQREVVPVILAAPASSSSTHPSTRASRTLRSSAMTVIRRAAWSVSVVAAAAGTSAPAISIVVIVSRGSAWRTPFLCFHLIRCLSVTLGKLDFNLPATDPLPVQAVKSILCIAHILEYAGWLRVLFARIFWLKTTQIQINVFISSWKGEVSKGK